MSTQDPRHEQSHDRPPRNRDLGIKECWELLAASPIGRIGLNVGGYPQIYPVNFTVLNESIYFRTTPDGPIGANIAGTSVSFQVDWVNENLHTGWSVLILGQAEQVDDPAIIASLEKTHQAEPWADGPRTTFFRIIADQITGRHVRQI